MIIRQADLFKGWTKIDNHVTVNRKISDGAHRLYVYYSGLKHGDNFVDNYVVKALDVTQQVLAKRRRELKKAGLIVVDQIGPRIFVMYLGNSKISALAYKLKYEAEERERAALPEGVDDGE